MILILSLVAINQTIIQYFLNYEVEDSNNTNCYFHRISSDNQPSLNKILKQNKTLEEIAWSQSHKVKSPLANILGLVSILKIDKTLTQKETEECLNLLYKSTKDLDEIINETVLKSNKALKTKIS